MILIVDDEPRQVDSYLQELKFSRFEVELKEDVDEALDFVRQRRHEIELLILDIIMPPGGLGPEDTRQGLRSGLVFFDRVRGLVPDLPVLVLTNVSDRRAADHFRGRERVRLLLKEDWLPFELVEEVIDFLSEAAGKGGLPA